MNWPAFDGVYGYLFLLAGFFLVFGIVAFLEWTDSRGGR